MILVYIAFGLMTTTALYAAFRNMRLAQRLTQAEKENGELKTLMEHMMEERLDRNISIWTDAEVGEIADSFAPRFIVYRQGLCGKRVIKIIGYNPTDPDDREYKRIHAEEVAEILNEEP